MSEYGLRIRNYQASTIYECNLGVRDRYDFKEAVLSNSLFLDYLVEIGIEYNKDGYTKDIIGVDFDYGTRSYEKEEEHLCKLTKQYIKELRHHIVNSDEYKINCINAKLNKVNELIEVAYNNKEKYTENSKEKIREIYYVNGIDIKYPIWKRTRGRGAVICGEETVHYKMLYRSTGKAKKGNCMFIREELFNKARNFLYMGIELPDINPMIVEISAYAPLISSAIVGRIRIDPNEILVLEDIDSFMTTDVISIETDKNKHCHAVHRDNYKLKNTIFDGQALIDSSIFPKWGNGYILLRQHFCKMAAFNSNIQLFFKDYFKEKYDTATVTDMFGVEHYVKDIKLITTDNALKWLKFGVSYKYWADWVRKNDCFFGIVKTAHESKIGRYQRMSYQMVNALDINTMKNVVKDSVDYISQLKVNDEVFLDYLKKNANFSNEYEMLIALARHNPEFKRCEYFRDRRKKIIYGYVSNFRSGKVIQEAENLVIVGSPYAMLLYATCGDKNIIELDNTFKPDGTTVECFTPRFKDGEYLGAFRSPFNSRNNLDHLHNVYSEEMLKYFNFTEQIIAVNMIGTFFQDRN